MYEHKIKSLAELQPLIAGLKKDRKKIVHCHGCFDIIHIGHIKHFHEAKQQGDILIVTVTPDRFINKGPGRPLFTETVRVQALAALAVTDYVALNEWETAVETIHMLRPDVYVKGKEVLRNADVDRIQGKKESASNLQLEIEAVKKVKGRIYLTEEYTSSPNKVISSSNIINQISDLIPSDAKLFLQEFKKETSAEQVVQTLQSLKDVKVLVIGDTIIDEYMYCTQLDRAGKEPLVAYKFVTAERQAGGVLSVANTVAQFSNRVTLLTAHSKEHKEFIRKKMHPRIRGNLLIQEQPRTLIKRRYVEQYRKLKLFEVYSTDHFALEEKVEKQIIRYLSKELASFDLVIVSDFGHGFMTPAIIDLLVKSKKFLAVNCQLNAGNLGYNFITKYKRADFVSLNEKEIRLPLQERTADISSVIAKLNSLLDVQKINVTLGKAGMMYYEKGSYFKTPSFNKDPIDTIGAGDAVLSLTALLAYQNAHPRQIPFLGNCIGALAVNIMGNRKPVDSIALQKFIKYLLK